MRRLIWCCYVYVCLSVHVFYVHLLFQHHKESSDGDLTMQQEFIGGEELYLNKSLALYETVWYRLLCFLHRSYTALLNSVMTPLN